jgi:hypothetical protein
MVLEYLPQIQVQSRFVELRQIGYHCDKNEGLAERAHADRENHRGEK